MIDGISADHFERSRGRLPHLDRLAGQGTRIVGISPEMCGTSSPGRTSIVTGAPPSEHGIYGNRIFSEAGFRWANPYDVKSTTLPALAMQQGLDVANIGYGMVRPEDCSVYQGPWWACEMLMHGPGTDHESADAQWRHAAGTFDPDGRLQVLADAGLTRPVVIPDEFGDNKLQMGMVADQQLLDVAVGLACSEQSPDFILLEIAITDYYLHKYGADHPLTDWSLQTADAEVGTVLARLERAGMLDEYNFAVVSDHGHADMSTGFYVDRVLDGEAVWSSEGGVLMVRTDSPNQSLAIEQRLAEHGIEAWNNDHLPADLRDRMLTFVMPEGSAMSFEASLPGTTGVTGPSKYQSNHGMRPGTWADYRFCLFSGPDIPQQVVPAGEAIQVAPTLAEILGVDCPWSAPSLF